MQVFNPFFFFPVDHSFGDTLVISPGTFSYQNKDSCQKYMHTHHIFHFYCLWACQLSLYSREFPALNLSDLYDLSTKSLATAMCWHKRHGIAVTWLWWRCFHRHVNKLCTRTEQPPAHGFHVSSMEKFPNVSGWVWSRLCNKPTER